MGTCLDGYFTLKIAALFPRSKYRIEIFIHRLKECRLPGCAGQVLALRHEKLDLVSRFA